MAGQEQFRYEVSEAIRHYSMSFPDAAEGSACVNRAFSAGGKNFVFLGERPDLCTLRLKLVDGWQKFEFAPDDAPSIDQLKEWINESFLLLAPKRVQRLVDPERLNQVTTGKTTGNRTSSSGSPTDNPSAS